MKKLLIIMITLALIAGVSVNEAKADPSIAVTVTMEFVDVSVTPNVWDIVTIAPSDTAVLPVIATNGGNVNENLTISVTNSDGWLAGPTADSTHFRMEFALGTDAFGIEITTGGVTLVNNLSPGDQNLNLRFTAPDTNSVGTTQQDITVTVSATAS